MPSRPLRTLLATLLALCLLPAAAAGAASSKFTIRGAGFGHGVGMSQYGAYGFAQNGSAYRDILAHYYTDTAIGSLDPARRVRVLLQSARGDASFTGATRAGRRRLSATPHLLRAPARRAGPAALAAPQAAGHLLGAARHRPRRRRWSCAAARPTAASRAPTAARSTSAPGTFSGVDAVNSLPLDSYLRGVVPDESPPSWPIEALKAQAVAARTYAVATMKPGATFDLYPDTRSQVYGGVAAEELSTNQAIAATRGEVVTYNGQPVVTFFFSTSGGRTEDVENTPLGNEPRPWLKSVDDPYDDTSPRHRWGPIRMSLKQADAKLGSYVKGAFRGIEVVRRGRSPRIVEADVIGTRGRTRVTGGMLRARFGLFDSWAFFTSITTGDEPPPENPEDPGAPTGGTEPFGSAAALGAPAGRRRRRARAAGAARRARDAAAARQRALGDGRLDPAARRRALLAAGHAHRRVPRALPRRDRPRRPRPLSRVRAVIFDCDGVLVDSEPTSNRVLAEMLTEFGLPMTAEQSVAAFMGRGWTTITEHVLREAGRPLPDDFHDRYLDAMFAAFETELAPVAGVAEALDAIDLPSCVASSGPTVAASRRSSSRCRASSPRSTRSTLPNCVASSVAEKIRWTLGHTGLLERFDGRIFSATEVEHGKPAPDLFLHAAATLGWEPADCAVVEDSRGRGRGRPRRRDDAVRLRRA